MKSLAEELPHLPGVLGHYKTWTMDSGLDKAMKGCSSSVEALSCLSATHVTLNESDASESIT